MLITRFAQVTHFVVLRHIFQVSQTPGLPGVSVESAKSRAQLFKSSSQLNPNYGT
jgi:hypothetical protein